MQKQNLKIFLTILFLGIFGMGENSWAWPAFPGAEGMGASATGARGYSGQKTVYIVTNTNDSGDGSLRSGISGTGKEGTYVVFATSGTINLESSLAITSSYITIAGQTSPGGIAIAGNEFLIGNGATSGVHDIIISYMRFREGSHNCGSTCNESHAFSIWKAHDIIIDHCSFSWGIDETATATTYNNASVYNVVFSWCIFSEGLTEPSEETNHGYGFLFNGNYYNNPPNSISIHHSFFASHNGRMPQFAGNVIADFRNNVIYNWWKTQNTTLSISAGKTLAVNFINNYTKPGPESNACDPVSTSFELTAHDGYATQACAVNGAISPYPMLYMAGNFGCSRDAIEDTEWAVSCGWSGNVMPTSWRQDTPFATSDIAVSTSSMTPEYASEILTTVGASKPVRDSHDTQMAAQYENGTGVLRANVVWPDNFPIFQNLIVPVDSDSDGMSDNWENSNGLNPAISDSVLDLDSDGYANIEEYFHYLVTEVDSIAPAAPNGLSVI